MHIYISYIHIVTVVPSPGVPVCMHMRMCVCVTEKYIATSVAGHFKQESMMVRINI